MQRHAKHNPAIALLARAAALLSMLAILAVAFGAYAQSGTIRFRGQEIPVEGRITDELEERFTQAFGDLRGNFELGDYRVALARFDRDYLRRISSVVGSNNRAQLAHALSVARADLPLGGVRVELVHVVVDDAVLTAHVDLRVDRDDAPTRALIVYDAESLRFIGPEADADADDLT